MSTKEFITTAQKQLLEQYFKDTVDPYEVVECAMDSFDPYTYINIKSLETKYPLVHKVWKSIEDEDDEWICEFEADYLQAIK